MSLKPHWHSFNPWAERVVYVPLNELARCLHHLGERIQEPDGSYQVLTVTRQLAHWRQAGSRLDAYVLPQSSGQHSAGVRFGPRPEDYLSPYCNPQSLQQLLDTFASINPNPSCHNSVVDS